MKSFTSQIRRLNSEPEPVVPANTFKAGKKIRLVIEMRVVNGKLSFLQPCR